MKTCKDCIYYETYKQQGEEYQRTFMVTVHACRLYPKTEKVDGKGCGQLKEKDSKPEESGFSGIHEITNYLNSGSINLEAYEDIGMVMIQGSRMINGKVFQHKVETGRFVEDITKHELTVAKHLIIEAIGQRAANE